MLVQLYSGHIQGGPETAEGAADVLDRAVMLVYEGDFASMDGPVTITAEHLSGIANHHNRAHALKLSAGDVPMRDCPPIQLDHSTSARDTVGRLVGPLHVDTVEIEGRSRLALLGTVRFLGEENVTKAKDGRYTHVSIGADLETNVLKELSVTPFPAAPKASLLSKGAPAMDKEKLKKHLMKTKKCSAEDAEKQLGEMDEEAMKKMAAEADEDEKKMAAEEEEKKKLAADEDEKKKDLGEGDDDEEKKKGEKKDLAAANAKITKLTGLVKDAQTQLAAQRASLRAAEVSNRLMKLRASGQLTPAEQKVLLAKTEKKESFVKRLAAASDDTMALVFELLEAREPVITPGQFGSLKAVDLSAGGKDLKSARLAEGLKETVSNMPFSQKAIAATKGGMEELLGSSPAPRIEPTEPAPKDAHLSAEPVLIDDDALAEMRANEKRLSSLIESITAAL